MLDPIGYAEDWSLRNRTAKKEKSELISSGVLFGDVRRRRESFSSQITDLLENSHLVRHRLRKQFTELFSLR